MKLLTTLAACAALLVGTSAVVVPTTASARDVAVRCWAQSNYATGVGVSYDYAAACRRALHECAIRTPYGYTCYVVKSEYVYV